MNFTKKAGLTALSLVTVAGMTACGPDDGAEVNPVTARQAIESNTVNLGARISGSLKFLEASTLFEQGFEASSAVIVEGDDQVCEVIYDEAGMYVGEDCSSGGGSFEGEEVSPEIDTDLNEESQELAQLLNERVFADGNVESETGTSITYLIRGETFCGPAEGPPIAPDGDGDVSSQGPDPECISDVDEAEIRLVVTSPVEGDVDIAVLVGPDRLNPLDLELHSDSLAAEVDLAAVKGTIAHLVAIADEEPPELPATFEGRIRAELHAPSDTELTAAISILQAINVADGDYTVQIGVSQPAFEVQVDGAAKTLATSSSVGGIDAAFPVTTTTYAYDEQTGAETENESTTHYALHIPATSHEMLLDAVAEVVSGSMSLSDTATFSVEGAQVLAIDLNADDGRALSYSAKESANGGVEFSVDPGFDLKAAMSFAQAIDHLDDIEEWMLDDVFHISLSGAAQPTLRIENEEMQVVEGTLSISLEQAGTSVEVSAGQCLIAPDDAPTVSGTPGVEPTEPTEPTESALNPIEELSAGTCGG